MGMCAMAYSYVRHDLFIFVECLIHMRAMTHSYVSHDLFIYVSWLLHLIYQSTPICMRAMTHPYACHDSFKRGQWLICIRVMTFSCVYQWRVAYMQMSHGTHTNKSWNTCKWVIAHIQTSHGPHANESTHTYKSIYISAHISGPLWMSLKVYNLQTSFKSTSICRPNSNVHQFADLIQMYISAHISGVYRSAICRPLDSFTYVPWLTDTCAMTHS